jgi:ferredoxin
MNDDVIQLGGKKQNSFMDKVKEILPDGGNLNLCLTCGACSSGCPATGLEGMDPRKFLRMAALGLDDEIAKSDWPWMCTMCQRCIYVCPMKIDIPQLVYNARALRPREERPKGILGSCDMALRNASTSAMGTSPGRLSFSLWRMCWKSTRKPSRNLPTCRPPSTNRAPKFFLNQNSREPVTEPDELVPCGRSCIWPASTGHTAVKDGPARTTACSWRTTTPGSTSPERRSTRPTNWG